MSFILSKELDPTKTYEFWFCIDVFNDDKKWKIASNTFEYIGNLVGGRIWRFIGTLNDFELKLKTVGLVLKEEGWINKHPEYADGPINPYVNCFVKKLD